MMFRGVILILSNRGIGIVLRFCDKVDSIFSPECKELIVIVARIQDHTGTRGKELSEPP